MRGDNSEPDAMFSYISPAQRVPKDHPLRAIRAMVDGVLGRLCSDLTLGISTLGTLDGSGAASSLTRA